MKTNNNMRLICLGSGSDGNQYILTNGTETLLLECGLTLLAVKKAMNFDLSSVNGCLLSHSHASDHAKAIKQFLKEGIRVHAHMDTLEELGVKNNHFAIPLIDGQIYKIGNFTVLPFLLEHDVTCFGYLIQHQDMGKLLFVTDTSHIPYSFKGLQHILIEANYSADIIDDKVLNHGANITLRNRVINSHMELETVKDFLTTSDLTKCRNIVLLHLSNSNSHAINFKKEIEQLTGVPTTIADKGVEVNLKNKF